MKPESLIRLLLVLLLLSPLLVLAACMTVRPEAHSTASERPVSAHLMPSK